MGAGLRQRKRELLRTTIEKAAVALVLEHGYENVTVEMICEKSLASPRTFFNYFGSKEAAVIGPTPPSPDAEAVEEFVHRPRGDVLSDLTRLMGRVMDAHGGVDLALLDDRREIVSHEPQLLQSMAERFAAKDAELTAIVNRRLQAQHRATDRAASTETASEERQDELAPLLVSLWGGVARCAMRRWAEHPDKSAQQVIEDLLPLLARIKES